MKYGSLILEKKEYVYLKRIINISGYAEDFETKKAIQQLSDELKSATIIDEKEMPADVIRFNSKVTVASDNGWERTIQIVMPMEKDLKQNKVSILTPMGTALIGYSKGDTVVWDFPKGKQNLKITNVIQEDIFNNIEI
ncbi:MAG: GreA/GreB family elongation factor [Flavobacterium sp.]|jgi:regulator of nucleoside diphosphate kinase|uniref:GreA/GreB family elongation factor n=1 Tax=Flavobacterium sp. TaxID=239 RepID=UPI002CDA3D4A|nr:GreA/GreB family elongation factor [Flavobacterium sp.]MCA0349050.1 GreA/GreB family elongation factor [Bacteroidota bacterium]HQA74892.1 GreA/GreB family elongation factor [Flavobacterium sp.]